MTVLLVLASPLVSACDGGGTDTEERVGPVTLDVVSADWTGWSRKQPEPVTKEVSVSQGDTFVVSAVGEDVTFTVSDVDDEGLWVETDQDLIRDGDGFDDADDEFEVENGVPLELTTPSMDAGTTITLTTS